MKPQHIPTQQWSRAVVDWSRWLAGLGKAKTTRRTRTSHLRHLADLYWACSPWELTAEQIVAWIGADERAQWTKRSRAMSVRLFYRWAVKTGRCAVNPTEDVPVPPAPRPRPRPTPDNAYDLALRRSDDRLRLMLRLAAELGMRCDEVSRVHQDDLVPDLDDWSLIVRGKGDRDRTLPLPPGLSVDLRLRFAELGGGWLFPGKVDGHLSARWVGKLVARALPGVWTMHTLRHRFGTRAYAASRDLLLVQELLGHASPNTTQGYVAVPSEWARQLVTDMARR